MNSTRPLDAASLEAEIRERARTDPTLHAVVHLVDRMGVSREVAYAYAVLLLSGENAGLREAAREAVYRQMARKLEEAGL